MVGVDEHAGGGAMIRVLSFGAGVQSTCILRMSLDGEMPALDHVIFADPGAELPKTYENVDLMERICQQRGIGFHRVTAYRSRSTGNITQDLLGTDDSMRWSSPPLFVQTGKGVGQIRRQCTSDYKTDPIGRKFRELCGVESGSRGPKEVVAEQWLGIHAGEIQRMKASMFRWFTIVHPLIELVNMTNGDCVAWLQRKGYPVPPKSACAFCPYQSDRRWLAMAEDEPETFAECVKVDEHIRSAAASAFKGTVYMHRSCRPLADVVATLAKQGAMDLDMFEDECHGVCGV